MQRSLLISAAIAAAALGGAIGASQAGATDMGRAYCATPTWSEGLDCDYQTFQQCVAAVAGFNRTCVANPNFSSSQAQFPPASRQRELTR